MYTCAYQRGGGGLSVLMCLSKGRRGLSVLMCLSKGRRGFFILMCLSKRRRGLFVPGQLSLLVATKPAMRFNLNGAFVRPHNIVKLNNGKALRVDGFKSHQHATPRRYLPLPTPTALLLRATAECPAKRLSTVKDGSY